MHDTAEWFDPKGLADWLGIPVRSVYQWNYKRTGPVATKVGKHVRYRREDVEAWLAAQRVETAA